MFFANHHMLQCFALSAVRLLLDPCLHVAHAYVPIHTVQAEETGFRGALCQLYAKAGYFGRHVQSLIIKHMMRGRMLMPCVPQKPPAQLTIA